MRRRQMALFALMIAGLFILAACADSPQPTATLVPVDPTVGGEPTPTPGTEPIGSPEPTATAAPADPEAGMALFGSNGCSSCHSTGSDRVVGPGLAGLGERAATRVEGLSAEEYITQSIREPNAYVVDGFTSGLMPAFGSLSDADVNNLIAYLETLE